MARPNLSYLRNAAIAFSGLFCGILTGLTVAAGSVISTPIVRYLLGLRPARASATALAVNFCAALTAITTYAHHHKVSWAAGVVLAISQIAGVSFAERLGAGLRSTAGMRILWSIVGIAAGLSMIGYNAKIEATSTVPLPMAFVHSSPGMFVWIIAVGLVIGALSQVMDLGGVLIIPACMLLLRLDPLTSQGTAMVGLLFVSLSGLLIYLRSGSVETTSAIWMSFGGLFGGLIGAYFAVRLAPSTLVTIFGIVLALIALGRFLTASGSRERPAEADVDRS